MGSRGNRGSLAKHWCITDNNPDLEKWDQIEKLPDITYGVWQLEMGENKTRHIQAYIEFSKKRHIIAIKKLLDINSIHCEVRKGTPAQAADYCKKDDTVFKFDDGSVYRKEVGALSLGKGSTSDEAQAWKAAADYKGMTLREIAVNWPGAYGRRYKGLQALRLISMPPRRVKDNGGRIEGMYIWGPTAAGKTTAAVNLAKQWIAEGKYQKVGEDGYYIQQPKGSWFDGYEGEEILILNEMSGNKDYDVSWPTLLAMFDPFKMEVAVKGGFIRLRALVIIITTNCDMNEFYPHQYNKGQFERRMNLGIIEMEQRKDVIIKPKRYKGLDNWKAGKSQKEEGKINFDN